jgi:hypothetical protein
MKLITSKFILLPASLILLTGFCIDLWLIESAFPRSGAVVVALSIPFFFWGKGWNADYRANPIEKGLIKLSPGDERRFGAINPGTTRESLARSLKTFDSIADAEIGLARAEVWVLMVGTLVWAFGDWMMNGLRCGDLTCSS